MKKIILLLVLTVLLDGVAFSNTLISGTYRKGSNITEPKPVKSEHMATEVGGFGFITATKEVKYVLNVDITKPFDRPMYVKAEFQNPLDAERPFFEDATIPAGQKSLNLVYGPVVGLKIHRSYWVKISLYEIGDHNKAVDTLKQNIKSYFDTTNPNDVLIKKGLDSVPQ